MSFAQDTFLYEAVKKYILAVLYKQGVVEKGVHHNPRINWAMNLSWGATNERGIPRSDEELGQSLRAMTFAVQLIESGFSELASLKRVETVDEEVINPSE